MIKYERNNKRLNNCQIVIFAIMVANELKNNDRNVKEIIMNRLQNNIYTVLPDDINNELLQGYGGCYCILNTDTWQMYSHTKRKVRKPVFCSMSGDGKLYESEESAINSASRILSENPEIKLCVTYYGLALSTYFQAGLTLQKMIKNSDGDVV
ncbi:MAG: hypothetical protein K6G88_08350 [Lachnospiraceae bacterium]|nr:hypothetical protein [Lachnospiraceae bacterium]